ncbi:MAG: hypothetical protein JW902_14485 [Syntrophaceae bacterium]|nr:hypothetical protein [Syntrophaceae bacterium]
MDVMTGGMVTAIGEMPILCSTGVATPEGLQLLLDAGYQIPPHLFTYRSVEDYLIKLKKFYSQGWSVFYIYVHPASEIPPEVCYVKPEIMSSINNKAHLSDLVPLEYVPDREIINVTSLRQEKIRHDFPVFIKAVTDEASGGGYDIRLCHTPGDLQQAASLFSTCKQVVVEDFLRIKKNLCLGFAIKKSREIIYLGCSEQITDAQGKYKGNWFGEEATPPSLAIEIATKVARRGMACGYYGWAGIDVAILEDDRIVILDLNFRTNGSTATLLLEDSIHRHFGSRCMRLLSLKNSDESGSFPKLLRSAYAALDKGLLLPLFTYNPEAAGYSNGLSRMSGLILGADRAEVIEHERQLADLGLIER